VLKHDVNINTSRGKEANLYPWYGSISVIEYLKISRRLFYLNNVNTLILGNENSPVVVCDVKSSVAR
jgi:hypothetical protein